MPPAEWVTEERITDLAAQESPTQPDAVLWWSITVSVLLHIGFLLLFGYFSANTSDIIDLAQQRTFKLVLLEPIATETNNLETTEIEPPQAETVSSQPDNTATAVAETAVEPAPIIAEASDSDDREEDTPAANAALQINTDLIRAQLREQLDAAITLPDHEQAGNGLLSSEPIDVPGMPAGAGWLNNYVGTVEASIQRWGNPGEAVNARVVLPSGHVICIQGAAPAHGEIFHIGWPPIAMSRICGRERPTPVDTSDIEHRHMIRPRHAR